GIENDATAARAERFANGIVALAHAATNYDETFAALVGGTASGFRRYFDDLSNGREERAAEAAARFAAEVELALIPTGAAALHLRNVAKARAGGVLTSVRRAAARVSPPSPVVPRPAAARGSSWVLDDNLSVDLSSFERGSIAARGGVAEPIVVLNRGDGWGRGGYASKGGAKRGPKPFGTGPHNLKIRDVADSITDGRIIGGGQRPGLPEAVIPTPGGFKSGRRPDILVQRPDGSVYGINVGKQNTRTGAPIRREAEAISDLEGAGIEMHFVPYN
ncbi:hypothetical protein L6V77_35090, partial [Myxococcota bacterium]|nr:hypothetical protein [Myxococcota bacterium]